MVADPGVGLPGGQLSVSVGSQKRQAVLSADTIKVLAFYITGTVGFVVGIYVFVGINAGGNMDIISLLIFLAIGALVGWLAGNIVKGGGFGVLGNILVGIVGAVLGGFLFGLFGITTGGLLGSIVMATIGAVILLYLIGMVKRG